MSSKTKNLKAAPLPPIPVEPAALDVPACSQPSRAKIGKHGWSTGSPKMEPAKIEPRGGHNGVLKASGWQGKGENIDSTLSQHGCAKASGTFLGGPGAPSKIDSRRGQSRVPRGPKWRPEGLRGALGSQVCPRWPLGWEKDSTLSQHGFPQASWRPLGGP